MSGGYILHQNGTARALSAGKAGGGQNRLQVQSVSAGYDDAEQAGTLTISSDGEAVYQMHDKAVSSRTFVSWGVRSDLAVSLTRDPAQDRSM